MLNFEDTEEEPLVSSRDSLGAVPFDRDIEEDMELYHPGERVTMNHAASSNRLTKDESQMAKPGRLTCQPKSPELATLTEEELLRIDRPSREQKASFGKISSFTIDSTNSNVDLKLIGKDEGLTRLLQIPEAYEEPSDTDDDVTETTVRAALYPKLQHKSKSKRRH